MQVTRISVPSTYVLDESSLGKSKPLILDCEYEVEPDETGLVIKWFLNGFPVYQWIPNSKPLALSGMKNKIDTTYEASKDGRQKFRAMSITQPSWNMTGDYTCSVQTFSSSDKKSANLQVIGKWQEGHFQLDNLIISTTFSPRKGLRFGRELLRGGSRNSQVQCGRHFSQTSTVNHVMLFYSVANEQLKYQFGCGTANLYSFSYLV